MPKKKKKKSSFLDKKIKDYADKCGYTDDIIEKIFVAKEWIITILSALILATVFKTFFYEAYKIPSGSMNPLLVKGDRVLVNKYYYGYSKYSFPFDLAPINERILANRTPKRGDVIVFRNLNVDKNNFYIKRVIGLPGDKIQLKNNEVYINNNKFSYTKLEDLPSGSERNYNPFDSTEFIENNGDKEYSVLISEIKSIAGNTGIYIVPEDNYFCMGDNRDNSKDSRFSDFSTIPFKYIVGKAERIFFSTAGGSFNLDKIFKSIEAKEA